MTRRAALRPGAQQGSEAQPEYGTIERLEIT